MTEGPGSHYDLHAHPTLNVYYIVHGVITVHYPSLGLRLDYSAGDRFEIVQHVPHESFVGASGAVYVHGSRRRERRERSGEGKAGREARGVEERVGRVGV